MTQNLLILAALAVSFGFGFSLKSFISKREGGNAPEIKVTGVGGIFFKCKDPKAAREWYKKHLGFDTNDYGATFRWMEDGHKASLQWSPFKESTKYFEPSGKDFMINYKVSGLPALVEQLKKDDVTIVDTLVSSEYGSFIHIMDNEGNKVELWEPN